MADELPILESFPLLYDCPIDSQPITRPMHLARLAAGLGACQTCLHQNETGSLPKYFVARIQAHHRREAQSVIQPDGVRGLSINQLSRESIVGIVQHVINVAHQARLDSDSPVHDPLRVVTGYDTRPSSPDLAVGVVSSLKRGGCDIVDVGKVSRPMFEMGVARFRPHVGIFVTGGERPHHWNGLDLVDHTGLPWSLPGMLSSLEERLPHSTIRNGRSQGHYESLSIDEDYRTALELQLHAIRPLRLAVACPDPLVRETLTRLLEGTSCSVHLAGGTSISADGVDRSHRLLTNTLCERRLDAGFLIGQDGRSCRLFDEGGNELTPEESLTLLRSPEAGLDQTRGNIRTAFPMKSSSGRPQATAMTTEDESQSSTRSVVICEQETEADLVRTQRQQQIPIVADRNHRFWFLDETPQCDALLTLARVLEVLSLSDQPVSDYRRHRNSRRSRL